MLLSGDEEVAINDSFLGKINKQRIYIQVNGL